MKTRLSFAVATAALALTQATQATEVAPYFETWAYGGSYTPSTLMQARSAGGVTAATMAFGVSGGGCSMGGGLEANLSGAGKTDILDFQAAGGRVILSFGGASGTYLEGACSDDGMYDLIRNALLRQAFALRLAAAPRLRAPPGPALPALRITAAYWSSPPTLRPSRDSGPPIHYRPRRRRQWRNGCRRCAASPSRAAPGP